MGTIEITAITPITVKMYIQKNHNSGGNNMYEDFDFYRAGKFLEKTKQVKFITQAVTGLLVYNEIQILEMIESERPCNYYMIEKLYCLIMQEMNYDVPFTLVELHDCIKNYPKKRFKGFNKKAYRYVKKLHERLQYLYPV